MGARNIEFGEGMLAKTLDMLGEYVLVTMEEPWELLKREATHQPREIIFNQDMRIEHLEAILKRDKPSAGHIVGFGGGTACDTAKYLSWQWGIPLIIAPSIISVDAWLCRSIAVRFEHRVRYIGDVEPKRLIVDYALVKAAPAFLNRAGIADVISICTALGDWQFARDRFQAPFDQDVFDRAKRIADELISRAYDIRAASNAGIRALVDGQAAEVELCEEWGNARPEEGGEHFLAYCLEDITHDHYIHGNLIALNTLVVLKLQREHAVYDYRTLQAFFDTIGIRYDPGNQGIRREHYRVALEAVHNYVQKENLFPGLWSLPEVFEAHGEYSIEGILDWIYAFYDRKEEERCKHR